MSEVLLSVRDLHVHFPLGRGLLGRAAGSVRAIDGVSLELRAGETLGIVGEFGCGKSTLGRAILRLIKATAGNVVWFGRDLHGLDAAALRKERRNMQIIFQDPLASLDPRMTVGQIIARPLKTFEPGLGKAESGAPGRGRHAGGRPGAGDAPALPARIFRRPVPAHRHRPRHDPAPEAGGVRRAGLGARRLHPGADHQPACAVCRGRTTWRCCSSRTTSASCATSATASSCSISAGSWRWPSATPSTPGPCIPIRRPCSPPYPCPIPKAGALAPAHRAARRSAVAAQPAAGLPLLHPLPARHRSLPPRGTCADRSRRRPSRRLPLCGGGVGALLPPSSLIVTPAKAGVQGKRRAVALDARFRGHDMKANSERKGRAAARQSRRR